MTNVQTIVFGAALFTLVGASTGAHAAGLDASGRVTQRDASVSERHGSEDASIPDLASRPLNSSVGVVGAAHVLNPTDIPLATEGSTQRSSDNAPYVPHFGTPPGLDVDDDRNFNNGSFNASILSPEEFPPLAPTGLKIQRRVIVHLDVPFAPESSLAHEGDIALQRREIHDAQAQVISELVRLNANIVEIYEAIPFITLDIEEGSLDILTSTSEVDWWGDDRLVAPTWETIKLQVNTDRAYQRGLQDSFTIFSEYNNTEICGDSASCLRAYGSDILAATDRLAVSESELRSDF